MLHPLGRSPLHWPRPVSRVLRAPLLRTQLHTSRSRPSTITRDDVLSGEEKSGHIVSNSNESILWFDNLFPLKLTFLFFFRRPWSGDENIAELLKRFDNSSLGAFDPINLVKRAIPENIPMKVTEILPRLKDGGAFVKVNHGSDVAAEDLEGILFLLLVSVLYLAYISQRRSQRSSSPPP